MEHFLDSCVEDFQGCESIPENSLPPALQGYLNMSASDSKFREVHGTDVHTWECVSRCIFLAVECDPDKGFWRYLNGLLLISRNLVCTKGAGSLAWSEGSGLQALLLTKKLLKLTALSAQQERVLGTVLQFIANMTSEAVSNTTPIPALHVPIDQFDTDEIRNFCRQLATTNAKPILVFLETMITQDPAHMTPLLVSTENGKQIFTEILTHTEIWYSQNEDHELTQHCSLLVNRIVKNILHTGYGPHCLKTFSTETITPDQWLSMLKLFDAAICSLFEQDGSSLNLETHITLTVAYYTELENAATKAIPFIQQVDVKPEYSQAMQLELRNAWNSLVVLLDTLHALLDDKNESIKQALLSQCDILTTLVTLLGEAQKTLPRRGKLSEINDEGFEPNPEEFPLIKGKIITLLSLLTLHNPTVQNRIRELHGLEMILSNCMIDRNNPFIRERAILCIRYLLEGNAENQAFVAKLEAKETVSEGAIDEAGYQTEFIDGKLKLKKKQ